MIELAHPLAWEQADAEALAALSDPAGAALDPGYRGDIHAMALIVGDPDNNASWTSNAADDMEACILNLMSTAGTVVASEDALSDLTCAGELAGARIVGRFENGTPVELDETGAPMNPIRNNFDYSADPTGRKCPLHGHIRKSNPRGESAAKLGVSLASERSHIMARRGITYGRRTSIVDPQDQPEGGVGLLFMAYQQNLSNQFEFTQASWVNNENFVAAGVGRDPIIGQGGVSALKHFSECPGDVGEVVVSPFGGFVTFKGGEYFFAPAKSTLASL